MDIKNTLENKAAFFALYNGQWVYQHHRIRNGGFIRMSGLALRDGWLELESLSCITNSDAIEIAKMNHWDKTNILEIYSGLRSGSYDNVSQKLLGFAFNFTKGKTKRTRHAEIYWSTLNQKQVDYLRSKGYLLPFRDITTEELIEFDWAKLKQ